MRGAARLNSLPELKPVDVDGWNVAFHHDVAALIQAGHVNPETVAREYLADGIVAEPGEGGPPGLGALFAGFFHYFGYEFDFHHTTVRYFCRASSTGAVLTCIRRRSRPQVCIRDRAPLLNTSKGWSKPINIEGMQKSDCTAFNETLTGTGKGGGGDNTQIPST